jgi:hypothetical protein
LKNEDNEEIISGMKIPENVRTDCAESFSTTADQALCMRTSLAGISVGMVNASIRQFPIPDIEAEDPTVADETSNRHPIPQCRLNTYYQGSLCPVSYLKPLSQIDDVRGTCHPDLNYTIGLRPNCWYKP